MYAAALCAVTGFAGLCVFGVIGVRAAVRTMVSRGGGIASMFYGGYPGRPGSAENVYLGTAEMYLQAQRYSTAITYCDKTLQVDPSNIQAYMDRAACHDGLQRDDLAVTDMQQAAAVAPHNANVWGDLGWYQYLNEDMNNAIASSRRALALQKFTDFAEFNLALCYATTNDWPDAKRIYLHVLSYANPLTTRAATNDVLNALRKQPGQNALVRSLALLRSAGQRAPGRGFRPISPQFFRFGSPTG
ncbi:MAG TPA: hypothetical protein VGS41_07045 [Chthonomonadales bacterium]|nr:hypothetical protein [Chthonomonadales bacterium]